MLYILDFTDNIAFKKNFPRCFVFLEVCLMGLHDGVYYTETAK